MDGFIWWFGAVVLVSLATLGLMWVIDEGIDWFLDSYKLKREFIEWYQKKLRGKE